MGRISINHTKTQGKTKLNMDIITEMSNLCIQLSRWWEQTPLTPPCWPCPEPRTELPPSRNLLLAAHVVPERRSGSLLSRNYAPPFRNGHLRNLDHSLRGICSRDLSRNFSRELSGSPGVPGPRPFRETGWGRRRCQFRFPESRSGFQGWMPRRRRFERRPWRVVGFSVSKIKHSLAENSRWNVTRS